MCGLRRRVRDVSGDQQQTTEAAWAEELSRMSSDPTEALSKSEDNPPDLNKGVRTLRWALSGEDLDRRKDAIAVPPSLLPNVLAIRSA
jgi:hypothetical protein